MNKLTLMSSILLCSSQLFAIASYHCTDKKECKTEHTSDVNTLSEAFSQGVFEGQVRVANIDYNYAISPNTFATSVGGQLKYETGKLYHTSVAISTFISQKVPILSGEEEHLATDFFGENNNSIAYLGEAYIDYAYNQFHLKIGRQKVDTPLNDRDDVRMLPNTFEAVMLGYGGVEHFIFVTGYIDKWAGFDSGDDISQFKNILSSSDKGVSLLGVTNDSISDINLQLWIYAVPDVSSITYTDAIYAKEYQNQLNIETGVQFGLYNELQSSNVDGEVYGAKLDIAYNNFTFLSAFNGVHAHDNKSIILGYGGGPYFTSMEEMTIDKINDVQAYVLGFEYNFYETLNCHYAYGHFEGNEEGTNLEVEENDIVLSYTKDSLDLELSYANINDKLYSGLLDHGYDRVLFRANYNFTSK